MEAEERKKQLAAWRTRIGGRIAELRADFGLSLQELANRTHGLCSKSQISNYEHGIRMPSVLEAAVLSRAFGTSTGHLLCLDDQMPALSQEEIAVIRDLRDIPKNERQQYMERIHALAEAHRKPIPGKPTLKVVGSKSHPRK